MKEEKGKQLELSKPLTLKQARLMRLIQENTEGLDDSLSMSELMIKAGYSPQTAKTPSQVIKSKPFQEFFQTKISRNMVVSAHKKLLKAKQRVRTYKKGELVTEYITEDTLGISKGVDLAYKVMGAFAPVETKHTITGLEAKSDEELDELLKDEEQALARAEQNKPKVIEGECTKISEDKNGV
jgi:hypothetical protein